MKGQEMITKGQKLRLWVILLLLATVAYSPSLFGELVWDDHAVIEQNPQMKQGVIPLLTTPFASAAHRGYWRPVVALSLWLDYQTGNGSPFPFRLVNLLLHMAVVVLFCLFVQELLPQRPFAAWTAAWLFALHPAQAEAVAWIVGRTNLLSALFALLTVKLGLHYFCSAKREHLLGAMIFFLFALLSKESGIVVMILVPFFAWLKGPIERRPALNWFLSTMGIAILWFSMRLYVLGSLTRDLTDVPFADMSFLQRIPLAIAVLGRYVQLAFIPFKILPVYPGSILPANWVPSDPTFLLLLTILVGFFSLGSFFWRKEPFILGGFIWFLVALLPVSHLLLVLNFPIAARCMYLPLMGASLAVALLLEGLPLRLLRTLLVLLIVAISFSQVQSNCHMWSNDVTLWRTCIARRNGKATLRVLVEMGLALSEAGQAKEAMYWYSKAEQVNHNKYQLQVKMARAEMQLGHMKSAAKRLRAVLKDEPNNALAARNLVYLLSKVSRNRAINQ